MYPSYGLLSHVPTQGLFDTKIGMMQKMSVAPQGDPPSLKILIDHKLLDGEEFC